MSSNKGAGSESHSPPASTRITIARSISWALHPFLVGPLVLIWILCLDGVRPLAAIGWTLLCAGIVIVPLVAVITYKLARKQVTDADVSVREHRYSFYVLALVCMLICYLLLGWMDAPRSLRAAYTGSFLTVLMFGIVTRFWTKVSIHTGILSATAAASAFFSPRLSVLLAVCTLLIAWSRLTLKRHSAVEVISGMTIASSVTALSMVIGLR